jgi:hypothetical protein
MKFIVKYWRLVNKTNFTKQFTIGCAKFTLPYLVLLAVIPVRSPGHNQVLSELQKLLVGGRGGGVTVRRPVYLLAPKDSRGTAPM